MPLPEFELVPEPSLEELDVLDSRVNAFNVEATGYDDGRHLVYLARGADGELLAGLAGHSWGGIAEVRLLWVHESLRHRGLGSRLLAAAEREARARGCDRIFLSTHTFQAPEFYRRHGYAETGAQQGCPRGHGRVFFCKPLGPERDGAR
jgi:GNAT superfamily N-acetyltransferase